MKFAPAALLLAGLLAAAAPASAKSGACYSPAELEAEAYLRLHSQLMVITVTCRTDDQGNDLVSAYTGFTKTNIAALHAAEMTMQQYYKVNYGGNGQSRLDDLRTRLGNEYGQEIADISAPVFCGKYRDKPIAMAGSGEPEVKKEVVALEGSAKSYGHLCATPAAAKKQ